MSTCDPVTVVTGGRRVSLTIAETHWTIEGDPDAVWLWASREGAFASPEPSPWTPASVENTRIHTSGFDPARRP